MKKFVTIKKYKTVTSSKVIETEEKILAWWFKFLRFLFADDDKVEDWLREERNNAYWNADKQAHLRKEEVMQKKLYELGYEVRSNFPMAKILQEHNVTELSMCDPAKIWLIVPRVD